MEASTTRLEALGFTATAPGEYPVGWRVATLTSGGLSVKRGPRGPKWVVAIMLIVPGAFLLLGVSQLRGHLDLLAIVCLINLLLLALAVTVVYEEVLLNRFISALVFLPPEPPRDTPPFPEVELSP